MVAGQTPYVTPHILHKHYAQAHDYDPYNNRMYKIEICYYNAI